MLYSGNVEPALDELLGDPITRLLLGRDGLAPETTRAIAEDARQRLHRARQEVNHVSPGHPKTVEHQDCQGVSTLDPCVVPGTSQAQRYSSR
jgi:hypothetical protein